MLLLVLSGTALCQTTPEKYKAKELSSDYLVKTEHKTQFVNKDLSVLWTSTDNSLVYGFIGDNYQRIRIKFTPATKDIKDPYTYNITGRSMVKNNICDFKGTLKVTNIRKIKTMSYGVDGEYKDKGIKAQYIVLGDHLLSENRSQKFSGQFKGAFRADLYLTTDGKIHYDNIDLNADGYSNDQFVGSWISYDKKVVKTCNWGDYRIPNSGDLDIGAAEFSPADKYLPFGWQTLRDSYSKPQAKKEEHRDWWK